MSNDEIETRATPARPLHRRFARRFTYICVIGIAVGLPNTHHDIWGSFNLAGISALALVGFWSCVAFGAFMWAFHCQLREAFKPIPSLQEIDAQLRAEGFSPSLADVIAVEQHLKSQRNEQLLIAGGIYAGIHLAARQASGKPPLKSPPTITPLKWRGDSGRCHFGAKGESAHPVNTTAPERPITKRPTTALTRVIRTLD
jgi:hypothetical protein